MSAAPLSIVQDPRTGRPWGDHGTAGQAIEFALDRMNDYGGMDSFLRAWREGDLDEWPEFYSWLADREASTKAREGSPS